VFFNWIKGLWAGFNWEAISAINFGIAECYCVMPDFPNSAARASNFLTFVRSLLVPLSLPNIFLILDSFLLNKDT
jgi:hypothetical protein